jgi:ribosome-binding protein aMBF1 (putative translation factor)
LEGEKNATVTDRRYRKGRHPELVEGSVPPHHFIMPEQPKKIFDLMDTETEPTDEQLEELMQYVIEAVREKKALAQANLAERMEKAFARTATPRSLTP